MPFFFAKLIANRPDFPQNMTAEEGAAMQGHFKFLGEQLEKGALVVAGPVMDPAGVFGLAVFEAATIDEVKAALASDPARAIGSYAVSPMGDAITRPRL